MVEYECADMHVPDRVLCHQRVLLVHVQLGRWGLGAFWLLFGTAGRLLGGCKYRYGLWRVRGILAGPCLAVHTTGPDDELNNITPPTPFQ